MNILKTLFLVKELRNKKGDLHFRRWRLIETKWFNIYIHQFYRSDLDRHCHDHPWSFVSFLLWGGYTVARPSSNSKCRWDYSLHKAPSIIFNRSKDFHKVEYLNRTPTVTLMITGPPKRDWGYWVNGAWVHHKEYRDRKRNGEWENE